MTSGPSLSATHSERLIYGALLGLGLVGALTPRAYNVLPAENILEAGFLVTALLHARRIKGEGFPLVMLAVSYLGIKVILAAAGGSTGILDFIQGYKAYIYLCLLPLFMRANQFTGERLARATSWLTAIFAIKYLYSRGLGVTTRPGVYLENNFELILLLGMTYLAYPYMSRGAKRWAMVGLGVVVACSGSRSAAIGFILLYLLLFVRTRSKTWLLHVGGLILAAGAVLWVFNSRGGLAVTQTDRYNFFEVFKYEVSNWRWWEFLTGSYPLTPLTQYSCDRLSFYDNLFSYSHPGSCYSVILHAFLFRVLFDQGVIGLLILYFVVVRVLRVAGSSWRDVLVLMGIITASALSVSAFNNVFVALVVAIAASLQRKRDAVGKRDATVTRESEMRQKPPEMRTPRRSPVVLGERGQPRSC